MDPMEPMKLEVSSDPGLNRREAMDPMEVMKLEVSCTLSLSMDGPLKPRSVGVVALLARGGSSAASDENRRKRFNGRGRRGIDKPSLVDIAKRMQEAGGKLSGELEGIRKPSPVDLARRVGLLSCQELLKCYELKGIRKPSPVDLARLVGLLSCQGLLKCHELKGIRKPSLMDLARHSQEAGGLLSGPELLKCYESGESASESPPEDNSSPCDSASEADTENEQVEGEEGSSRFNECEPIRNHSLMDRAGCQPGAGGLSSPELKKCIAESTARFCIDCGSTVHPEGTFCHHCGVRICG